MRTKWQVSLLALSAALCAIPANAQASQGSGLAQDLIIFVPDGLRSGIVTEKAAPNLSSFRKEGVNFQNSHSLFATFTMPNVSAIATGHYFGDTGDLGSTIYTAFPVFDTAGFVGRTVGLSVR